MDNLGDYIPNSRIDHFFNTNDSTGAAAALITPSSIYVYRGNATTATTAGATCVSNYGLATGLNYLGIDLSSSPTYYSAGYDYHAVLTAGSINGVNVTNYNIAEFSIGNRGISPSTMVDMTKTLLGYDWNSVGTVAARSMLMALRTLRNRIEISSGILTTYLEDDLTPAWTATLSSQLGANPITGIDPI